MFRSRPAPAPCLPRATEEAARCGRADGARARPPAARPHPRPGERRELLQDPAQLRLLQRHRSVVINFDIILRNNSEYCVLIAVLVSVSIEEPHLIRLFHVILLVFVQAPATALFGASPV